MYPSYSIASVSSQSTIGLGVPTAAASLPAPLLSSKCRPGGKHGDVDVAHSSYVALEQCTVSAAEGGGSSTLCQCHSPHSLLGRLHLRAESHPFTVTLSQLAPLFPLARVHPSFTAISSFSHQPPSLPSTPFSASFPARTCSTTQTQLSPVRRRTCCDGLLSVRARQLLHRLISADRPALPAHLSTASSDKKSRAGERATIKARRAHLLAAHDRKERHRNPCCRAQTDCAAPA